VAKRIRTHANPLSFHEALEPIQFDAVFSNYSGSLDLEIGFGKGVFISKYAARHPQKSILAVDVRKGLFESIEKSFKQKEIHNVHLVHGTGERVLAELIPDGVLDRVFLFHPDPWFKKRHCNRRVIQASFLETLKQKLSPTGAFMVSTDVEVLWDFMEEKLRAAGFKQIEDTFWQTDYQSHWSQFSETDERNQFMGSWVIAS